jgi:hypothetical protein
MLRGKGDATPAAWVFAGAWGAPLLACLASLDAIFSGPLSQQWAGWRGRAALGIAALGSARA